MEMKLGRTVVSESEIKAMVPRVANEIKQACGDDLKDVLFVGIMKGAYIWMADLLREIGADVQMDYIHVSSYANEQSTGVVTVVKDIQQDVNDRIVILLDEVIDTGLTLQYLKKELLARGARKVLLAVATDKREQIAADDIHADFVGIRVPNEFLVGYGMDYNNHYRNLGYIAVLE
ncbi:hypoxanthine phosphoribosyltransferase [Weissella diestrammenae]|uniref:Hypoxanthine phosphoribosyltransferase n=1 Tax=Weissella diestrammenae TaxID=1162633 RepID=A0A7G9T3W6_9LACO|nr:hypoxanthine phosphoribosyltransferase [Weissella diestrammenae]MCM0582116.1 hypoxanthine phosphoribosyltransferase [Weissella diestrammenae]QNN74791.1 hypoxanthine phosphoribosyltransferase [Weissella diestrammenae]